MSQTSRIFVCALLLASPAYALRLSLSAPAAKPNQRQQTPAVILEKMQKIDGDHWLWFEHFSRAGGKTMDLNAFVNGYRGWGAYAANRPWNSRSMNENLRPMNRDVQGLVDLFETKKANYMSSEDAPLDFLGFEKATGKKLMKVTMMREPVAREASLVKNHIHMNDPWKLDNEYVRRLQGDGSGMTIEKVNETHLEKAKKVLSTFDAVLIFENYTDGYNFLECKLGWCVVTDMDAHDRKHDGIHDMAYMTPGLHRCTDDVKESFMEISALAKKHKAEEYSEPTSPKQFAADANSPSKEGEVGKKGDFEFDTRLYEFAKELYKKQREECK